MTEKPTAHEIVDVLLSTIVGLSKAPRREIKTFGMNGDELLDYVKTGIPVRDPSSRSLYGTWIHKKTGHRYELIMFGLIESTLEPAAIYRNEKGQVWIRPVTEFFDGRFLKEVG